MTPTATIISRSAETQEVVDCSGRRLILRIPAALDKLRIFKAAGADLALNQPWISMAILASSVTAIDDIPVPFPTSEGQIEALISRLGDVGLDAVARVMEPVFLREQAEQSTIAGNSTGTLS